MKMNAETFSLIQNIESAAVQEEKIYMIDKLHVHEFVQGVVEGDIFITYCNCKACTLAFMLCGFLLVRGDVFVHL